MWGKGSPFGGADTARAVAERAFPLCGGERSSRPPLQGTERISCDLVGGDAYIAPPSIGMLPYVVRVDVGIDPYKFNWTDCSCLIAALHHKGSTGTQHQHTTDNVEDGRTDTTGGGEHLTSSVVHLTGNNTSLKNTIIGSSFHRHA